MPPTSHTYGPTCRLSSVVPFSSSRSDDDIPALKAQFFYSSPLPIDDPLTVVPTPSSSENKFTKYAPRPFSAFDNIALEEAWHSLGSEHDRKCHHKLKNSSLKPLAKNRTESQASIESDLAAKHNIKRAKNDSNNKSSNEDRVKKPSHIERAKAETAKCSKCNSFLDVRICSCTKPGCTACTTAKNLDRTSSPTRDFKKYSSISASDSDTTGSTRLTFTADVSTVDMPTNPITTPSNRGNVGPYDADAKRANRNEDAHDNPSNLLYEDSIHRPPGISPPLCCSELENDVRTKRQKAITRSQISEAGTGSFVQDIMAEADRQKGRGSFKGNEGITGELNASKRQNRDLDRCGTADNNSLHHLTENSGITSRYALGKDLEDIALKGRQSNEDKPFEKYMQFKDASLFRDHVEVKPATPLSRSFDSDIPKKRKHVIPAASEVGTTGFPFQRVPLYRGNLDSRSRSPSPSVRGGSGNKSDVENYLSDDLEGSRTQSSDVAETILVHHCKARQNTHNSLNVPVGISRLHLVKLPDLQMMPIYWSPVHDVAAVTRGTWFYKDTMYPVEPPLANQLEIGYRELRPWSQTWSDELNSALEVGAVGEEKISHRIWPKESDLKEAGMSMDQNIMAVDSFCAARCFYGEVAAVGTVESDRSDQKSSGPLQVTKRFPNSHVIYKDAQNAFILKPSLQPSEYYGRKPLAKIKKGLTVGIHVVRSFDWKAWGKLHGSKKSSNAVKVEEAASVAEDTSAGKIAACAACLEQEERPKVTDLILVIHGIGQKLSERIESFHFTHAINLFRRAVNIELNTDAVRSVLRKDHGGIMVLPVNWRSNLSFENEALMKSGHMSNSDSTPDFTLKDITPDTIPAVRNLVSDVMLDIPFYMSHHKPKMIEALIAEANRVYRLWCQNNTEFHSKGRVHVIAHSLGSAMALDVLSKQPTSVDHVDMHSKKASTKHFEFDTKSLFFAGSPAAFFLLLEKGNLVPRKGRNKPDAEPGDDKDKQITGQAGTFGCLAVDNLYNILHYNDPVAYRLNATVDPLYAATLKNAQVPSATTGWVEAIGNAMRSITPNMTKASEFGVGQIAKPAAARLPSQLEMEVHDFSREEIAEKKFYLLNDNGQIDYFLSSGGGPLEIQYLNMLSAHSSYWNSSDFIRMLVTEVGREPGKFHTLPNMKVVKVGRKDRS